MVTVMQIEQQRMDRRSERRARRHALRRVRLETPAANAAAPAEQLDPRDVRRERRDLDMIISLPA